MAILDNQSFPCKFYLRVPNGDETNNLPIFFKAELVGDKEKNYNQTIANMITPSTKIVLRTASPYIYGHRNGKEVKGFVVFQGDVYQVQNISYDEKTQNGLGVGKFSKEHGERNAIKVIFLV